MKRILSIILIAAILLGSFSSCVASAAEAWIIKGEFFSLVMTEFNYYPVDSTVEEMEASDNYDIEAKTMVDWELLDEDEAFRGLESPIDKETATVICFKSLNFVKEGNVEDIKDSKYLQHPELIANAVATGFVSLDEHGYFNGKEKLSYNEAKDLIYKAQDIEANGSFEDEGTPISYDFEEDFVQINGDDIANDEYFSVEGYDEACSNLEALNLSDEADDRPVVSNMVYNSKKAEISNMANKSMEFTVNMSVNSYNKYIKNAKIHDIIIFDDFSDLTLNNKSIKPFIGYLVSKPNINTDLFFGQSIAVILTREGLTDEEVLSHVKDGEHCAKSNNKEIIIKPSKEFEKKFTIDGFKCKVGLKDGGVFIEAKKQLEYTKNKYNDWRDQTFHPTVSISASITDFEMNLRNLKYFVKNKPKDADNPLIKVDYKTTEDINFSGSARYTPTNNGNGKFCSNFTRSRWTDGAGAKKIKIGKFELIEPVTEIRAEINVNLVITIDGEIHFHYDISQGFEATKQAGKIRINKNKYSENREIEAETKLGIGIETVIGLGFSLIPILMSYSVTFQSDFIISMKLSYNKEEMPTAGESCPTADADKVANVDKNFGFQINGKIILSLIGKPGEKGLIDKIIGGYKKAVELLSFKYSFLEINISRSRNYENVKEINQDKLAKQQGKFQVEKTKSISSAGASATIKLTGLPKPFSKIQKTYTKGIQVKVKNEKICEAWYNEDSNTIIINSKQNGSTELDVFVQKKKGDKQEYLQEISVTVFDYNVDKNYVIQNNVSFQYPISDVRVYAI